jgi:hypothetical protein
MFTNPVDNELETLAAEFAELRRSENKGPFPKNVWKKAIELAQQMSVDRVSKAINIPSSYLKRKMALLGPSNAKMTFVELITPKHDSSMNIKINIESAFGHKMIIEGINTDSITSILMVLLKDGGLSCCK